MLWILLLAPLAAWSDDYDLPLLTTLSPDGEELASAYRTPRPISRIAENVTVITSEQISALNVHTLNEVLQHVPGIQLDSLRTPGSWGGFHVNSLNFNHVRVILDGIVQNDLLTNFPDVGIIPARQIERIEIIKGSASAAWGPALGGVVNIITKSPDPERSAGGSAVATYGEKGTTEVNAELTGTLDRFGYYLGGGNFHSSGLLPGNGINFNHAWLKLSYNLPTDGVVTLGGSMRQAFRGLEESAPLNYRDTDDTLFYHGFIDYSQPLDSDFTFDLSVRHQSYQDKVIWGSIVPDPELPPLAFPTRQIFTSATAKLRWDTSTASLLLGSDLEHHDLLDADGNSRKLDRWAAYLNGSWTHGRFTLLPGVRFDYTDFGTNPVSVTLGSTWQLNEKSVIRGYAAQGYGLPTIYTSRQLQRIRTVQLGAETSSIPYLWLKGTLFYNYIWDIDSGDTPGGKQKEVRQGGEVEVRTTPLLGVSFGAGYTYSDNRDKDTHKPVLLSPEQSLKASLDYKSSFGLSGILSANYVWWNGAPGFGGHYSPVIWDLTLTQKIPATDNQSVEVFFNGHNLFNGSQYTSSLYKNTPRWIEGGVRFKF